MQQTINFLLLDGMAEGRWLCNLRNWSGLAYRLPRMEIAGSSGLEHLDGTGVYFLFGYGQQEGDRAHVYIGKSDQVYTRLMQHLRADRDFWTECVAFVSSDGSLNEAHAGYLEHQLYLQAKDAARYMVHNDGAPHLPTLSPSERSWMGPFLENIGLILGVMGYKVLIPIGGTPQGGQAAQTFYIRKPQRGIDATARVDADGFFLLKGSRIIGEAHPSLKGGFKKQREQLLAEGVFNDDYRLRENTRFSSPSAAATLVLGRNANGWQEWRNAQGLTLREAAQPQHDEPEANGDGRDDL